MPWKIGAQTFSGKILENNTCKVFMDYIIIIMDYMFMDSSTVPLLFSIDFTFAAFFYIYCLR